MYRRCTAVRKYIQCEVSLFLPLQQTSKVCRVDIKPVLREEEILPTVSLKTHAQPVRYRLGCCYCCCCRFTNVFRTFLTSNEWLSLDCLIANFLFISSVNLLSIFNFPFSLRKFQSYIEQQLHLLHLGVTWVPLYEAYAGAIHALASCVFLVQLSLNILVVSPFCC